MGMGIDIRNRMAKRAAQEIKEGMVVNLGIGIPSLVPNHLANDLNVMFHAENGITGMGPTPSSGQEDENLCNAGGFPVTLIEGGSYCDSTIAFGMIRRGYVDLTILGSLQVSEKGDLANWIVPGKKVPGMGGAMELAQKANKVIVLMNQLDKHGHSKIVKECTLPLTSARCVDLIITDMAVFSCENEQLTLHEIYKPYSVEDIRKHTDCHYSISETLQVID
ncbi:3-oxoacid CoA-transferase subunit B [Cytobacillus spongiae]|jgi:acetate CoA/acetoacetate CoA-transferase beta subunit|uniref:3-oxoacid CoA-transferase subunit B n=1 Tax=Cytobacillus spongiae TaxID=2901381 RepID=UPI001F3CFD21|nr:3-oxoacid CoA-transferase subunit B [Cytobacillus spongiae]UII54489.1 3-oxoacid CoA-transferase subunit B [Cytobacillus spongiae]